MDVGLILVVVALAIGAFALRRAKTTADGLRSAGDTGGYDSTAPMGSYDASYATTADDDRASASDNCSDAADASSWDTCDSSDSSSSDSSSSD
ncbi:hypothetical protein [Lysobacter xanthus]